MFEEYFNQASWIYFSSLNLNWLWQIKKKYLFMYIFWGNTVRFPAILCATKRKIYKSGKTGYQKLIIYCTYCRYTSYILGITVNSGLHYLHTNSKYSC